MCVCLRECVSVCLRECVSVCVYVNVYLSGTCHGGRESIPLDWRTVHMASHRDHNYACGSGDFSYLRLLAAVEDDALALAPHVDHRGAAAVDVDRLVLVAHLWMYTCV